MLECSVMATLVARASLTTLSSTALQIWCFVARLGSPTKRSCSLTHLGGFGLYDIECLLPLQLVITFKNHFEFLICRYFRYKGCKLWGIDCLCFRFDRFQNLFIGGMSQRLGSYLRLRHNKAVVWTDLEPACSTSLPLARVLDGFDISSTCCPLL